MRFERGGDFEEGKERRSCPAFFHVLHTPATHPSEFRKGFLRNATAHPRLLKADYDFLNDCSVRVWHGVEIMHLPAHEYALIRAY